MNSEKAAEVAEVTYRQLHFWASRGYLRPVGDENKAGNGSGIPWEWTKHEVAVARRMGRLVSAGLRASVAAEVARSGKNRYRLSDSVEVRL